MLPEELHLSSCNGGMKSKTFYIIRHDKNINHKALYMEILQLVSLKL